MVNKRKFCIFSSKYGLIIVTVCILRIIHPVKTKSPKTSYWIRRLLVLLINTFKIVVTRVPAILCHFTFDGISIRVIQTRTIKFTHL